VAAGRVAVAMSGGVDSTVAAWLLREQGQEPIGLTLDLASTHPEGAGDRGCATTSAAGRSAAVIGMPHHVVDGRALFEERVLRPAWRAYDEGRTPNPCVLCNQQLKFGLLLEEARRLGIGSLATGHYVRRVEDADGRSRLLRGLDRQKDQSYFLFALSQEQLRAALFPLGELSKPEVRELARRHGLPGAERAESQDACLAVGDVTLAEALRQRFGQPGRPGPVEMADGRSLGLHRGIHQFTIGQRRGLGVARPQRSYVVGIDPVRAAVVVGDEGALYQHGLIADGVTWADPPGPAELELEVQIRYRHPAVRALARVDDDGTRVRLRFEAPQRAVTPGQAAVFYAGDRLLGGGWIVGGIHAGGDWFDLSRT